MRKKFFVNMPKLSEAEKVEVEKHFGLVVVVAKKMTGYNRDWDDMIQDGHFGLMRAVQKHDKSIAEFSTYACWWIRQSILRGIANNNHNLRVPVFRQDEFRKYLKLTTSMTIHGINLTKKQIEFIDEFQPEHIFALMKQDLSLNTIVDNPGGNEGKELIEFFPDKSNPDIFKIITDGDLSKKLEIVLKTLGPNESMVIKMRYGLDGEAPKTLEEVSSFINRTREGVRLIEKRALHKLRHPSRSKKLKEFHV